MLRMFGLFGAGMFLAALVAGCGGGPTKVDIEGKVTKDGVPLKVSKQGSIQVKLYSQGEVEEGKPISHSYPAMVDNSTATFKIKGIPVGKYLVTIEQIDPMPSSTNDQLEGAFTRKYSKIVREVKENDPPMAIELSKEQSSKPPA